MSNEKPRRKITLETRFGGPRGSRSRKDRPCDVCRQRKSACVIAVKPPCKLCEIRGLQCTFASAPRLRRRSDPASTQVELAIQATSRSNGGETPYNHVSPQASRFPIPTAAVRRDSENSFAQSSAHNSPDDSTLQLSGNGRPVVPDNYKQSRVKHSLEYGRHHTAHFIGLSGEQDTNLLASIRYNVLNETKCFDFNIRQLYPGNHVQGTPPIHFSILQDVSSERDQRMKRFASDAIESYVGKYGDALLRLYFQFVHPVFPVLSKASILMDYANDKFSIPVSLRGVIYGLGCAFWSQDPTLKPIPAISQPELFEHAHTALNRELDCPKISTLQTCLLILHEQPDVAGTTESPRIWALACQATACAQSLGLHQDPASWKLPSWEKRLRRRLWWITYSTDAWTSVCHGQTPHIPGGSFDTLDLTIDDLSSDEDVTGLPGEHLVSESDRSYNRDYANRHLEIMKLTKILRGVIDNTGTLVNYRQSVQKLDIAPRESIIWRYKIAVDQTLLLLPRSMMFELTSAQTSPRINGYMHLASFAVKFHILRGLMAPATPESKSDPSSRLCHYFNDALVEGKNFVGFVAKIRIQDLYVFWPRLNRTNLILSTNFLIYLFFCASNETQVASAYEMLQRYQGILQSLAKASDWSTIGLIRPSLLRTQSFFHGAAEGIRLAGQDPAMPINDSVVNK
ncbi:fungal-specific transcription factor domain-containing protein [Xylogone sp. PMI_703]|nr:fungal-specific transcription factor domain-containing protein [Xylogone sp. PMI_703]